MYVMGFHREISKYEAVDWLLRVRSVLFDSPGSLDSFCLISPTARSWLIVELRGKWLVSETINQSSSMGHGFLLAHANK